MTLSAPVEDPVLGKSVSDIQESLTIQGTSIAVEPKLIVGWTEFSSIEAEQTGYYVDFNGEVEGADHVIASIKRNGQYGGKPARTNKAKDDFIFFLGANADTAEAAEGIKIVGYDANNNEIGSKEYNLTVAVE